MDIATRNHEIVEHLRKRFKERYNVELTKNRRMMLLTQIHKNFGSLTCVMKPNSELWKVELYNQATYSNQAYIVLYDRTIDQIRTVLPPIESAEFKEFCERVSIPKEQLIGQRRTAKESTAVAVRSAIKHREQQAAIKEGQRRLKEYKDTSQFL